MVRLPVARCVLGRCLKGSLGIWLGLTLIFLATLIVNSYPIIDQDSQRYLPTLIGPATYTLLPQRASIIPLFLNDVPFRLFGIMGIPVFTSIVVAWALTLLLQELARVFVAERLRSRFCLLGLVVVGVVSFLPIVTISILSEPWSAIAFSLALVVLLSRKISVSVALGILVAGASHSTNLIIIGVAVVVSVIFAGFARDHLNVSLIVLGLLISGTALDRALFTRTQGDSLRVRYAFVGAAIMNFYPRIYDDFCVQSPQASLCRQAIREFVSHNRAPLDYSKSRFLWSPTRICRGLPGDPSLPDESMTNLEDYERESTEMLRLVAWNPVTYGPYILGIAGRKVVALFAQSEFYSHPYNLTVNSVREPWAASLVVRSLNKNRGILFACLIIKALVLGCLGATIAWLVFRREWRALSRSQRGALVIALAMYSTNLLIYGSIEAALSRYHYRAFFLLPLIAYALAWRLLPKRD